MGATFGMYILAVLVLGAAQATRAQNACPVNKQVPENKNKELNVPQYKSYFYRPRVKGDYIVIEYNASQDPKKNPESNKVTWTDYSHLFEPKELQDQGVTIDQNGSFLPVIYTKEKIAVRVCGLHFTDVLTITTSPNGIPEQGADIRGAAAVTPPASLSSTLDMLQSGMPTGGTTTQPGLGLGAATAIPTLTLSGITQGSVSAEDQTPGKFPSYTPATLTASGRQVALELFSLESNAKELSRLIDRTLGKPYSESMATILTQMNLLPEAEDEESAPEDTNHGKKFKIAPGSVLGVSAILNRVLKNVRADDEDPAANAVFDKDMTDIQNVNAQISTLSSVLTSQAFASSGLTLLNNFSVLAGVLDLAALARKPQYCTNTIQPALGAGKLSDDDIKTITKENLGNYSLMQVKGITTDQIKLLPKELQDKVREIQAALAAMPIPQWPGDKPICSQFEKEKINEFWTSYYQQVGFILKEVKASQIRNEENPEDDNLNCIAKGLQAAVDYPYDESPNQNQNDRFAAFAGCRMDELSEELNKLRDALKTIDERTTELYDRMNEWYFHSSVEQTDLLAPETSNAYVRLSIVVQRGYTPFTMANAGGAIMPTVTANAPATTGTASTSTPAHAVKTILIEVHRLANINLMGGVMWIHAPTASYSQQTQQATSTSTSGSYSETCGTGNATVAATSPPSYSCLVQTQKSNWQVAGMAGVLWYPWGHDYFPRRSGFLNSGRNLIPSLLLASSITSLGSAAGAVNWEPTNGIDLYGGVGSAHTVVPPPGFTANTIIPSGTTLQTQMQLHWKLTFGVGFDLSVFGQIFGTKGTAAAGVP